jgi:hypothetical protein
MFLKKTASRGFFYARKRDILALLNLFHNTGGNLFLFLDPGQEFKKQTGCFRKIPVMLSELPVSRFGNTLKFKGLQY